MSSSNSLINSDYFVWLITSLILTTLILIVLVIVILICSSYKRKRKILLNSVCNGDQDVYVVDKCGFSDNIRINTESVSNTKDIKQISNKSNNANKRYKCITCCKNKPDSLNQLNEEGYVLIDGDGKIMNIEIRDRDSNVENIIHLSGTISKGQNEYENGRLSHIDRELPPLPLLLTKLECDVGDIGVSSIKDPMIMSVTGSLKYSDIEKQPSVLENSCNNNNTDNNNPSGQESSLSRQQSVSIKESPVIESKFGSTTMPCATCCCCSQNSATVPSTDDLSSTDYDPTYAAIRRTKVSCPMCGAPSLYTPVNSNRNSNLSLQWSSCLGSPVRCLNNTMQNNDSSLNNSTYASIAKLQKNNPKTCKNQDQETKSGCSTIRRQRSISQGDIIAGSSIKHSKLPQSELICDSSQVTDGKECENVPGTVDKVPLNYMSLWSLIASSRNSPYNMFPIIPERTYGQSVVDLVEKLRASDDSDTLNLIHSATECSFSRCFTQPQLFGNFFKRRGSLTNFKSKIWSPQSCQMIHGSSLSKFGLCSPLKMFDDNIKILDEQFDFQHTLGKTNIYPINKSVPGFCKRGFQSFQPVLTPPLSPMDCNDSEKVVQLNLSELNETKYENQSFFDSENGDVNTIKHIASVYEDLDSEMIAVEKEVEEIIGRDTDHYEYLSDSLQLCYSDFNVNTSEKLQSYETNDRVLPTRARPISIVLYTDDMLQKKDKYHNHKFDNLEVYDVSSVQMSPLMEQSLENSSSKTTLSSLSYPQFNRLISSEDSCAKSPPSADISPSLDNLEISPDDRNFLFNEFLWSNFNPAFDDYETFE